MNKVYLASIIMASVSFNLPIEKEDCLPSDLTFDKSIPIKIQKKKTTSNLIEALISFLVIQLLFKEISSRQAILKPC